MKDEQDKDEDIDKIAKRLCDELEKASWEAMASTESRFKLEDLTEEQKKKVKIRREAEIKAWLPIIIKVLTDVRNSTPNECEIERAYQMLSVYGVTKERAKSVSNGIDVLATRYRKEIHMLEMEIAILSQRTYDGKDNK